MSFLDWLQQLNFTSLIDEAMVVVAALLGITFHETCHGLAAYWLGDPTAKNAGRLTLNPIRHVDVMGLVMLAICRFGWAKPVPVDMRNFRHPKRDMALTALAGPVANLLLAFAALAARGLLLALSRGNSAALPYLIALLEYIAIINTGLAVFNFIPVSPLDGSKILYSVLPEKAYLTLMRYEKYGMFLIMALLLLGVLDTPLVYARTAVLNALNRVALLPAYALMNLSG
ncbi:MAG: site-2 protease family protein [Oscillospiraceae bacterium]|nr:site-2 protease family protein [Oscillospiraceae bacterium]